MSARIGVYGGAFDPPHRAHRALSVAFIRQFSLDVLHIVPTGHAYHRAQALSDAAHRLAMARLTFEAPAIVDEIEVARTGPSYTVDTVEALRVRYGDTAKLYVLVGQDQWMRIDSWHRVDDLMQRATIVVAKRNQNTPTYTTESSKLPPERPHHILAWDAQAVSSSEIRALAAKGEPIDDWVEPAVARYIGEHRLYRSDSATPSA